MQLETRPNRQHLLFHLGRILGVLICLAWLAVPLTSATLHAQANEPKTVVDAVLADLSAKLGHTVTRGNVDTYTWEEDIFNDSSLGCPRSGVSYAQVITHGYKILVTISGTIYDYRATLDGKVIFPCTPNGVNLPTLAPTPTAAPITIGTQPTIYPAPIAYVDRNGNIFVISLGASVTTPLTADGNGIYYNNAPNQHRYARPRWSPNGLNLAFVDEAVGALYLARSGQPSQKVAEQLAPEYAPFWSADSSQLIYAINTAQAGPVGQVYQLQAYPVAGGTAGVVGQISVQTGCGGGGADPALALYMEETAYGGSAVMLAQVTGGILYTTTCTGQGLALATPNGQIVWKRDDLKGAALSPDHTKLVAIRQGSRTAADMLEMVDLGTGNGSALPTLPGVNGVAWSADGATIYYSTFTLLGKLTPTDPNNPLLIQVFPGWPSDLQNNTVTLNRVAAAGGSTTQIFSHEGYRIGNIVPTADGGVIVSVVPSLAGMFAALNAGKSLTEVRAAAPVAHLYQVAADRSIQSLFDGGQPASSGGTFTALPAAGAPFTNGSIPPPTLTINGTAIVVGTTALNMRQSPSTSAPVKRLLKPGTVLTILAGPQIVATLRWWQVRAADGALGWVVDQVTDDKGVTENTLAPQ